ncbi:hypothetical protein K6V78_11095 [Streptococcus gallolyticus]|uniref:hypothetical protein n=1 Tax=Streptococcus hepaticus TaxID=3349163 RepID=UPI001C93A4F0|nr:hypothetical protein [Streptococcus gallolyticus]MBY5042126.1 hypothetical protein [Streptococcus gallolyticus]
MKKSLLTLTSLAVVILCLLNTRLHFLTGLPNQILLGVTFFILAYQVLASYREIKEHRQAKRE